MTEKTRDGFSPYDWYWISAIILLGYYFLAAGIFSYRRKIALQERGQKDIGIITKMWTQKKQKGGTTYWIKYKFTFKSAQHEISATLPYSKWRLLSINSEIEIIFDPQNPKLYNLPLSQLGSQCCNVVFMILLGLGWILGFGLGFGIGVFYLQWYHIIITTFVIPIAGFFLITGFFYFCCKCCCTSPDEKKGINENQQNYQQIEGEQQQVGITIDETPQ